MKADDLAKVVYTDSQKAVYLSVYAKAIYYGTDLGKLRLYAAHLGGEPEHIHAITSAIYGGGSITVYSGEKPICMQTQAKSYKTSISNDGTYSESCIVTKDSPCIEDAINTLTIMCKSGDKADLFRQIDSKSKMPMIEDFRDYIIDNMIKLKYLVKLRSIPENTEYEAWLLKLSKEERNIAGIIENGIKSGTIKIPNAAPEKNSIMTNVKSVTKYLDIFGSSIADRIKNMFSPLFDPETEKLSDEILKINSFIKRSAGYSLYNAQLAAAEALKRQLNSKKVGLLVADCGTGKTKIGSTALCAYQKLKPAFNVIMAPAHMKEKWVREIKETIPNSLAMAVKDIADLNELYGYFNEYKKPTFAVISKENARDGYMKMPAVSYSKTKEAFICPNCGEPITMSLNQKGQRYEVKANMYFFLRENRRNHHCEKCGSILWTCINPARKSDWIKIADFGFVYRPMAAKYLNGDISDSLFEKITDVIENGDACRTKGAYRRYPLSTYIKKKYRGKIDGFIADELHQYSKESGQGDAFGEILKTAKRTIGMTATLINGYSSGIFHLLYRVVPHLMVKDGKPHDSPTLFNMDYGVVENIYDSKEADYNSNRRTAKSLTATKILPGVSPLVYTRFLIEYAVFISIFDMCKQLPDYEEIPIALSLPENVQKQYDYIEGCFKSILRCNRDIARKLLSTYLNLLTVYPDQPYGHKPVYHPETEQILLAPKDTSNADTLQEKDKKVLEIVRNKIANGERVLIFTSWLRIDTQEKLLKMLREEGIKAEVLSARIKPEKREKWVLDKVDNGLQVLITNAKLIETGLDLNDFTALIFYNIDFNLFTFRQASKRSWRINQTAPRIEVYILYYANTIQHKAVKLMASKLSAAGVIEGQISDEGLSAMSECQDMMALLAKEITLGIRDSVEDTASVFKRMAFIKNDENTASQFDAIKIEEETEIEKDRNTVQTPVPVIEKAAEPQRITEIADFSGLVFSAPKTRGKKVVVDENQLSLFDAA